MRRVLLAVLLSFALTACAEDEAPRSSATEIAPSPSSSATAIGLKNACGEFAGHVVTAGSVAAYLESSALAQRIADEGDDRVGDVFDPIAATAAAAAETFGTTGESDDGVRYYEAVVSANDSCVAVDAPLFERVDESS